MRTFLGSDKVFKDSSITFFGSLLNGFLGALFYIFLARYLGPENFGIVALSIAVMTLIADIADMGTNSGLVRFVSAHLSNERLISMRFLKLGLETKLLIWIGVFLLGYTLSPFLTVWVFDKPELMFPVRLALIGVGGALLFSYTTSSLQAFQRFFAWSFLNVCTNLVRLIVVVALAFFYQLNITNAMVTYIALPFLGFSLGLLLLPIKEIAGVSDERSVAGKFFQFNLWTSLIIFITAFSSRIDTFLAARFLVATDLGLYSAANQLTTLLPQIVAALGVVLAPKLSRFNSLSEMLIFYKKTQLAVIGLGVLALLGIPLAYLLIPLIYGVSYTSATPFFIILLLAQIIFLISMPIHTSIFYYFGKPNLLAKVAVVHLVIVGLGGYYLITNMGAIGVAVTVLLGMVFNFFASLLLFWREVGIAKKLR